MVGAKIQLGGDSTTGQKLALFCKWGRAMTKTYGRNYVILWDTSVARYRVQLGDETIGFHESEDGARALAVTHASHTFAVGRLQPYSITFRAQKPSANQAMG